MMIQSFDMIRKALHALPSLLWADLSTWESTPPSAALVALLLIIVRISTGKVKRLSSLSYKVSRWCMVIALLISAYHFFCLIQSLLNSSLYSVLSTTFDCSDSNLRRAYRDGVLKLHPDKNPSEHAAEAFTHFQKVYKILSDPTNRLRYDLTGSITSYNDYAAQLKRFAFNFVDISYSLNLDEWINASDNAENLKLVLPWSVLLSWMLPWIAVTSLASLILSSSVQIWCAFMLTGLLQYLVSTYPSLLHDFPLVSQSPFNTLTPYHHCLLLQSVFAYFVVIAVLHARTVQVPQFQHASNAASTVLPDEFMNNVNQSLAHLTEQITYVRRQNNRMLHMIAALERKQNDRLRCMNCVKETDQPASEAIPSPSSLITNVVENITSK